MADLKDDGTVHAGPNKPRIALDPGHGGTNPGCQYPGLSEKEFALEFCQRLSQRLTTLGFPVILTRPSDMTQLFTARAKVAKAFKADLAISIHVNANESPKAHGLETYYMPDDLMAHRLATCIYNAAPVGLKPWKTPAIRAASLDGQGDDAVIGRYEMPAVLVEVGFASNESDRAYLLSDAGKNEIAAAIVAGIEKYWLELPPH